MEDNVQNNQIMDSWEEGSGDKSSDISSALDIIEFILNTDSQENTADSNEINTGATRLSTTIYQLESKTTETSKENSGPANKNRQFGASHERATETKDRNVNQKTVQGGYRRGSSPDSRTETMVTRGISRSSPDPNNGTQIQEDIDYNEVGEMDKDSTKREMRQFKDVPVKVSGSDAIPPTKQDGDGDDGRGLESISTSDSGYTSIVTAATLDDEEELLMKNNRPRKYQSTPQNSDKGIKKGGVEGQKTQTNNHQYWTTNSTPKDRRRARKSSKPARIQENQQDHRVDPRGRESHPGTSSTARAAIEQNQQTKLIRHQSRDRTTQWDQAEQPQNQGPRHKRRMERKERTQKRALDLQKGRLHYYRILV
nr:W protein [Wild boar parainfluenza virus 3]